ncbi:hypothetical protein Pint_17070 [Pistacia integerrima]|uniref:Uncharacterized protein n=1 Tax=Pistacia integerrima TaxID=434235 RepID=A0ACC0ZAQ2_9ROSI|nr:hypothetical protein Pint_17070 [Pistacia integerrima]
MVSLTDVIGLRGTLADFQYALVLEPTNKRASVSADRLRKVFM